MLMNIRCAAISSIKVHLEFDDHSVKDELIAIGDLIDVTYNGNGARKHTTGKVRCISTVGSDPKAWYIIVDASDDFKTMEAKFSPMNILDVEVIRKAATVDFIQTPLGDTGIPYLRVVRGRLQYSIDGCNWRPICIDTRDIIEPQEGTVPYIPNIDVPIPESGDHGPSSEDIDGIEDAVW